MGDPSSPPALLNWMASLSDPVRARMLRAIDGQELSVADLCQVVQLPQSTVSRHLKILLEEGFVRARGQRTRNLYQLDLKRQPAEARRLWALLRKSLDGNDSIRGDDQRIERVLAARRAQSRQYYVNAAERWDLTRRQLYGQAWELRAFAGLMEPSWTVADLGCGSGAVSEAIAPWVRKVIAVDSSSEMLAVAGRRLAGIRNVELVEAPIESLPMGDRSVDLALFLLVLHCTLYCGRAVREAGRVLKPGGRILIVDLQPHEREDFDEWAFHSPQGLSRKSLESWLQEAGLGQIRYSPFPADPTVKGPPLFAATATRNP